MTDTQRVDVERLSEIAHWLRRFSDDGQHKRIPGPSAGEAYEAGVEIDGITAALLQKIDQLRDDLSTARQSLYECAGQRNDALSSLAAAERARDEAMGLLREAYDTVVLEKPITPQPVNLAGRIAAFLAANGGRSNGP